MKMQLEKDFSIDSSKSPEQLTGSTMAHYDFSTSLMARVIEASKKPLAAMDDEDLRLMVSQKQYLVVIVPAAICWLSHSPFSGGNLEDGALIRSVFQFVPESYWKSNQDVLAKAHAVLTFANSLVQSQLSQVQDAEERSLLEEAAENIAVANKYYADSLG